MVILDSITILPEQDILWRFLAAFTYGSIGMLAVASLSLLLSSMANNSLGPILTTMAIIILFTMISTFEFSFFKVLQPFLLTSYLDSWQLFFVFEPETELIIKDGVVLLFHTAIFYAATMYIFKRRDILT